MKTSFSVAALFGLAAAQGSYHNPWGNYPGPPAPPTPEPEPPKDDRPEKCEEKIESLETQLTGVETQCDEQKSTLAGLNAMLTAQATSINPLVQSVNENQSAITFCTEANTQQQTTIVDLGDRLTAMSTILNGDNTVQGLRSELQSLLDSITGIDNLIEQIRLEEMRTNEIMMTIMTNTNNIISLNGDATAVPPTSGSVMDLMTRNTNIDGQITTVNDTISTQTTTVGTQTTDNGDNQTLLDSLTPMVENNAALTDYYNRNASPITFDQSIIEMLDGTEFCVAAGVPFELYATLASTGMTNAFVMDLSLRDVADMNTIYAASQVPTTLINPIVSRDRDMSILYKGVGTGQPVSLYYGAVSNPTSMNQPITPIANFQWGVKVFNDMYVAPDVASTC